jgi:hypothetical protein
MEISGEPKTDAAMLDSEDFSAMEVDYSEICHVEISSVATQSTDLKGTPRIYGSRMEDEWKVERTEVGAELRVRFGS